MRPTATRRLRGIAALFTTYGVGELSAINAIAGSYAEHVPVVHVVGAPATTAQAAHRPVHHTLGDGVFGHFMAMHAEITCARAALTPDNAVAEIDRVLTAVRDQHLPGYLVIPADVGEFPAEKAIAPLAARADATDPASLAAFIDAASRLLTRASLASEVSVLAGLLVHRLGAAGQLAKLLSSGPLTHATTLWAKSLVDESSPFFAGMYAGAASSEAARAAVEDAAVLIIAGVQFTDLNSGMFTQRITRERTIELGARSASVGAAMFAPLELPTVLDALEPLVAGLAGGTATRAAAVYRVPRPRRTRRRCPRRISGRRWQRSSSRATSSSPTRARRSTAWRRTGSRLASRSSVSRCGHQSATRCPRCSAPAPPGPAAVVSCSSGTALHR